MSSLVVPRQYLREAMVFLRQRPGAAVWSPLGICDSGPARLWLAGPVQSPPPAQAEPRDSAPVVPWLRIRRAFEPAAQAPIPPASANRHLSPAVELLLGLGEGRGHLWVQQDPEVPPVESVMLVGSGMHRIPVSARMPSSPPVDVAVRVPDRLFAASLARTSQADRFFPGEDSDGSQSVVPPSVPDNFAGRLGLRVFTRLATPTLPHSPRVRWSRTIGALGGEPVWQRLTHLRVALVGCGRSGSVLADLLAGVGFGHLVLIDPDLLEEHNLGEMAGVFPAQVGCSKVEAVAEHLRRHGSPDLEVAHLVEPLWSSTALRAAKRCDVLCVAADDDAARLTATIVSTLYHKLLLDCATGIQFPTPAPAASSSLTAPPPRIMGADVRLIVPGDGCLLCRGNLTNYAAAVERLCRQPMLTPSLVDWRRQRAGSLRSLNTIAAGLAVGLLEDLVAERLAGSVWAHLEFDPAGRLSVTYPAHSPSAPCVLCAKAGLGDAGLNWG